MGRSARVSARHWIVAAKRRLISDGISGVNIAQLSADLSTSRGCFYHWFGGRNNLLERLLDHWEESCCLVQAEPKFSSIAEAVLGLNWIVRGVGQEAMYDQHFDIAVREWARSNKRVKDAIWQSDQKRIKSIESIFAFVGFNKESSSHKAKVLYFYLMGGLAIDKLGYVGDSKIGLYLLLLLLSEDE
jgi:AcrR family transcriptional regulator